MYIRRLDSSACIPQYTHIGYSLKSCESITIEPLCKKLVDIGISIQMPTGIYGRIVSLPGLMTIVGEPDYTNHLKILFFNHGEEDICIQIGDIIAQIILQKFEICPIHFQN